MTRKRTQQQISPYIEETTPELLLRGYDLQRQEYQKILEENIETLNKAGVKWFKPDGLTQFVESMQHKKYSLWLKSVINPRTGTFRQLGDLKDDIPITDEQQYPRRRLLSIKRISGKKQFIRRNEYWSGIDIQGKIISISVDLDYHIKPVPINRQIPVDRESPNSEKILVKEIPFHSGGDVGPEINDNEYSKEKIEGYLSQPDYVVFEEEYQSDGSKLPPINFYFIHPRGPIAVTQEEFIEDFHDVYNKLNPPPRRYTAITNTDPNHIQ